MRVVFLLGAFVTGGLEVGASDGYNVVSAVRCWALVS